jgi:hypothetical protein
MPRRCAVCAGGSAVIWLVAAPAMAQQGTYGVENGGPSGLSGSTVYTSDGEAGGGDGMSLTSPSDELDDFSAATDPDDMLLCVSVDPASVGVGGGPRIPIFNVFDQAQKHQVPGDTFYTTEAFNRNTGILPPPASMGRFNNALSLNQSPEYFGGLDYDLLPRASPEVSVPLGTRADNIDGRDLARPDGTAPPLYFTVSSDSPSLDQLPNGPAGPSGANIFFDPNIRVRGNERLFVSFVTLGLVSGDDITGLSIWDDNRDGIFNGTDRVLFTLRRGSPTLERLQRSAADILTVRTNGTLQVFAFAQQIGLRQGDAVDSIRAVRLLNGSAEFTINHDVRQVCAVDLNQDGVVNVSDFLLYLSLYAAGSSRADTNGDGLISVQDYLLFLNLYSAGCP